MVSKCPITTHVLDTANGKPATPVKVELFFEKEKAGWTKIGAGVTNSDGRVLDLLPADHKLGVGSYRLYFAIEDYFNSLGQPTFYPEVKITFKVADTLQHYHVPILLSNFGYTTYRGS